MKSFAKKAIILILITVMIACMLTACGTSSPKSVTEKYFGAVKSGDLEKAIECFTPSVQAQYKGALAISNALFGMDSGAILGAFVGYANDQEYKDYTFKVSNVDKTDDSHAVVSVDVLVGGKKNQTTTVSCVKIDKEWYIEQ